MLYLNYTEEGIEAALLHSGGWLTVPPAKLQGGEGEAYVEKIYIGRAAIFGARGIGNVFTYHKSVLTARLAPKRSTKVD